MSNVASLIKERKEKKEKKKKRGEELHATMTIYPCQPYPYPYPQLIATTAHRTPSLSIRHALTPSQASDQLRPISIHKNMKRIPKAHRRSPIVK